jgi:hypothetical protein
MEYREKNNVKRNDFMQLLIKLKNQGHVEEGDDDKSDLTPNMENSKFRQEKRRLCLICKTLGITSVGEGTSVARLLIKISTPALCSSVARGSLQNH